MKWFKHCSNASRGVSLSTVHYEYGAEGMLAYFLLLELISQQYDAEYSKKNGEKFRFHEQILKEYLRVSCRKVQVFLDFFHRSEMLFLKKEGKIYEIEMPKLRSIMDNHTKNLQVANKSLTSNLQAEKEKEKEKEKEREEEEKKAIKKNPQEKKIKKTVEYSGPSPEDVSSLWNSFIEKHGQLDKCNELTKKSKKDIMRSSKMALKSIDDWRAYFDLIFSSKFLLGQKNPQWKADFFWVVDNENRIKVYSGKYHEASKGRVNPYVSQDNVIEAEFKSFDKIFEGEITCS